MHSHQTNGEPTIIRLSDYKSPDFLIDTIDLVCDLGAEATAFKTKLAVRRSLTSSPGAPLRLNGTNLNLESLVVDDVCLQPEDYLVDGSDILIRSVPDRFTVKVTTRIDSCDATGPTGLTRSHDMAFTHCEPNGFRQLTYFCDRPDVMTRFATTIVADETQYPVLLANGNLVARGKLPNGRHWARWDDPYPKACYLFAFVAGALVARRELFKTRSGRTVEIAIWVRPADRNRCECVMQVLKDVMRWEGEAYDLEYDLNALNVVALPEFAMNCVENKGLLIFNSDLILTDRSTLTEASYRKIKGAIAHEYLHNWIGNRVTIRDWFQLALKEGLTEYLTHEFLADRTSPGISRIREVRVLRATAAGRLRPPSCPSVGNLFIPAVYSKGAEIVRMLKLVLGDSSFRCGFTRFVAKHDGQAITLETFLQSLGGATNCDLDYFIAWYEQDGTCEVNVNEEYDPAQGILTLTVEQSLPTQPESAPLCIPLELALLDFEGTELPIRLEGESKAVAGTRLLLVSERCQSFRFVDLPSRPVVSLLRGCSAPVVVRGQSLETLAFLASRDSDRFARWSAGYEFAAQVMLDLAEAFRQGRPLRIPEQFVRYFDACIVTGREEPAYAAELLTLPDEPALADMMKPLIDIEAIHAARSFLRAELARRFRSELLAGYVALDEASCDGLDPSGRKSLRNVCLRLLASAPDPQVTALAQVQFGRDDFSDSIEALSALIEIDGMHREAAIESFYQVWKSDPAALDVWFAAQAKAAGAETMNVVRALTRHPAFDIRSTSRVKALILTFATENLMQFHNANGAGYDYLADRIIEIDPINTAMAVRLISPLTSCHRYDRGRQELMRNALRRIANAPNLSEGVAGIVAHNLA